MHMCLCITCMIPDITTSRSRDWRQLSSTNYIAAPDRNSSVFVDSACVDSASDTRGLAASPASPPHRRLRLQHTGACASSTTTSSSLRSRRDSSAFIDSSSTMPSSRRLPPVHRLRSTASTTSAASTPVRRVDYFDYLLPWSHLMLS